MSKITNQDLISLSGGASQIECFLVGAIFASALATGNIFAASGSGVFLAANCFN